MIGLDDLIWCCIDVGLVALAVLGLAVWGVIHPGVSPSSSETEDEKECTE